MELCAGAICLEGNLSAMEGIPRKSRQLAECINVVAIQFEYSHSCTDMLGYSGYAIEVTLFLETDDGWALPLVYRLSRVYSCCELTIWLLFVFN